MMTLIKAATLMSACFISASAAVAAGSDSSSPPKPTATTTECTNGQVYDEKTATCVDAQDSRLDDDDRYGAARELAYAGRYDDARIVLAAADNPQDPRILNYKGFVSRKTGDTQQAMAFYRAALDLDPDYVLARSYMGQALIQDGDLVGAKAQLAEIRMRNGRDTWAYMSLKQALAGQSSGY